MVAHLLLLAAVNRVRLRLSSKRCKHDSATIHCRCCCRQLQCTHPAREATAPTSVPASLSTPQSLEAERVEAVQAQRPLPNFQAGDILEVTVRVPENEGKTYTYRGVCIARANKSIRSTFTLYNVFPDVRRKASLHLYCRCTHV